LKNYKKGEKNEKNGDLFYLRFEKNQKYGSIISIVFSKQIIGGIRNVFASISYYLHRVYFTWTT